MDRNVEPDVLQEILWRMLLGGGDIRKRTPIRFPFSGTRLQKLSYAVLGYFLVLPFENMDFARNGGYDRSLS